MKRNFSCTYNMDTGCVELIAPGRVYGGGELHRPGR